MQCKLTIYELRKETVTKFKDIIQHDNWRMVNKLVDNLIAYYRDNYVSRYKYETAANHNRNLEVEIRELRKDNKNLRESLVFAEKHILWSYLNG